MQCGEDSADISEWVSAARDSIVDDHDYTVIGEGGLLFRDTRKASLALLIPGLVFQMDCWYRFLPNSKQ